MHPTHFPPETEAKHGTRRMVRGVIRQPKFRTTLAANHAFYYATRLFNSLPIESDETALPEVVGDKFLYFGFGSNLLAKRIHINNKSAVRKGIGKLKDYQLDFYGNSTKWNGAVATIIPSPDRAVWGAIWEIDLDKMDDLDRQEGVRYKKYYPLSVPVTTRTGDIIICRTYRLTKELTPVLPHQERPYDRQPSLTYLKTIVKGAYESNLPRGYINYLERFRHNGNTVQDLEEELDLTVCEIGEKKETDTEKKDSDTDKKRF